MRWLNRILSFLLALALVLGVLAVVGPAMGWYRTTTVLTGSMRPTIDPGDVVVTRPVSASDVEVGDILTFEVPEGSGTVTHRVVRIDGEGGAVHIVTKGDANDEVDGYDVNLLEDTAWRTAVVIPKAGYAFVAVRTVLDNPLYLPVIGTLLGAGLLWAIWRPEREDADVTPA